MSIRVGVIGAGAFAEFVCDASSAVPEVSIAAVADVDPARARSLAEKLGNAHGSVVSVLADAEAVFASDVDAVLIATPPSTHEALALAALSAGKHVLCEKPLAMTADGADLIASRARESGLVCMVNHVLRYNPILAAVEALIASGGIGPVRRFTFDNDASDQDLGPEHWFWNDELAGGIPVEHGVHFFDAAARLIGSDPIEVSTVASGSRHGMVDTYVTTARHPDGVLATHSHAFTHAHRGERQHMRLDHGHAETSIEGWIPIFVSVEAWVDDERLGLLREVCTPSALDVPHYEPSPGASVALVVSRDVASGTASGRGVSDVGPHRVRVEFDMGGPEVKGAVYAESVRAGLRDFAEAVGSGRDTVANAEGGRRAVRVAAASMASAASGRVEATGLA